MIQLNKIRQIALATMLACSATVANAAAIRLDDSSTASIDVSVNDGEAGDWNTLTGAITYIGSIGSWLLNVTTGITKPILGTDEYPVLHLDSVNVSGGGGTLDIWFSENNFVGSAGYIAALVSSLGGLAGGTVTVTTYLDASNTLFGTGTLLDTLAISGGAGAAGDIANVALPGGNYSLTVHATITHDRWAATSFNTELKVPEPGTLSLLGAVLVAAGFVGSRRRQPKVDRA